MTNKELWSEIKCYLTSAFREETTKDGFEDEDWNKLNQIILGSALVLGCRLLELDGRKNANEHSKVLFKIRNAFIHNNNDISINNDKFNKDAEKIVDDYTTEYGNIYFEKDINKQIIYKQSIANVIDLAFRGI